MLRLQGQGVRHGSPQASKGQFQLGPPRHAQLEPALDGTKLAGMDDPELVQPNGRILASGRVDVLALDGSVLWLIRGNGKGRAMFLPDDDVMVCRHKRAGNRPKS